MPAEKYGFKPTAAQMSFGEVQAHFAECNDYLCSAITGVTALPPPNAGRSSASQVLT